MPFALAAACVGYTPVPLDPLAELAALRQRVADARLEAEPPGRVEWFPLCAEVDPSDGLDLAEADTLALFFSPAVRQARTAQRVAGAQLLQAGLLSNPELFLGPRIASPGSQLIFPAWLAWELPLWGKQGAEEDVASARQSAATLAVLDVELRVLADVRASFVRLAILTGQATALQALASDAERVLAWVEGLARVGEADDVTLYLARLERDDAIAAAAAKAAELDAERRDLLAAIGLLPDAGVHFVLEPDPTRMPEVRAADIAQLLRHPELRAAQAEYEASEAALRLEVAKQYPSIRLGPEFESDRGDPSIGIGLGITLPLFDRNRGGIAEADVRRTAARERYQDLLLAAAHAEARARADWQAAERQLETYRQGAARDADAALRALELRLRGGQANVLEVLAARRAMANQTLRELDLAQRAATSRLRAAVAGAAVLDDPPPPAPEAEPEPERN